MHLSLTSRKVLRIAKKKLYRLALVRVRTGHAPLAEISHNALAASMRNRSNVSHCFDALSKLCSYHVDGSCTSM